LAGTLNTGSSSSGALTPLIWGAAKAIADIRQKETDNKNVIPNFSDFWMHKTSFVRDDLFN
jgi:hypothetical protein